MTDTPLTDDHIPQYETVPTVEVLLSPSDAIRVLKEIDRLREETQLLPVPRPDTHEGPMEFEVWIGGQSTCHAVLLGNDGTWRFKTHIVT